VKRLKEAQIAVVGLGLMGGSLAGALRGRCRSVIGVARRAETVKIARARGLIDRGAIDLERGVYQADLVVLATPVRVILHQLTEIGTFLSTGCLLMDLGSTKTQIVAQMEQLPDHIQPLGGHPMCGKNVSGIAAADPALYQSCAFVLTPLARTSEAAMGLARAMVEAIGAHPLLLNSRRHDRLAATTSHLPYLLACALVGAMRKETAADSAARVVAASGFHDTSRLAASDVTMMLDILSTNREAVLKAMAICEAQLHNLAHLVQSGDEERLRATLTDIQKYRRELY